jgi:allophanate hydrolase subunit 2
MQYFSAKPAKEGLIQQTPGGQIIILGPDGPVSGGYRRLGVVIAADWPYLAQISVNSDYEFIPVNREIAIHALKDVRRAVAVRSQFLRIIQQREIAKAS